MNYGGKVIRGALVDKTVTMGPGSLVDGAYVGACTRIGSNAQIYPGVVVNDCCFIGPGAILCNDMWPRVYKGGWKGYTPAAELRNHAERLREACTIVEDGASIGANATILPGIVIGSGAMVAAGATVSQNVPDFHCYYAKDKIRPIPAAMEAQRLDTRMRRALHSNPILDS